MNKFCSVIKLLWVKMKEMKIPFTNDWLPKQLRPYTIWKFHLLRVIASFGLNQFLVCQICSEVSLSSCWFICVECKDPFITRRPSVLLAHCIICHFRSLIHFLLNGFLHLVDLCGVLLEFWCEYLLVHSKGTLSLWMIQVHEEAQLQEIVEWNDRKDDSGKLVDDVEASETHPISEPHLVIVEAVTL